MKVRLEVSVPLTCLLLKRAINSVLVLVWVNVTWLVLAHVDLAYHA